MLARDPRRGERGAAAVLAAIMMVVLVMFLAMVINTGHMHLIRSELQNATDAAALAAAKELNGLQTGLDAAAPVAFNYAGAHETDKGLPVTIDQASDVIFGHWNDSLPRESAFQPITLRDAASLAWINAVMVQAGRETARGNAMNVDAGQLLSRNTVDVHAKSVAVLGGPCSEGCAIPIAFPNCLIVNPDGSLKCDEVLEFSDANEDNLGFTSLSPTDPASINTVRSILSDHTCRNVDVGTPILIQNGNGVNPVYTELKAYEGQKVSAPIISMECPPQFNQSHSVVGFATFTFLEVIGPPDNILRIKLDCAQVQARPANAGCTFFGTSPLQARLVR
jgi:Flp pilus assembly protein TadG